MTEFVDDIITRAMRGDAAAAAAVRATVRRHGVVVNGGLLVIRDANMQAWCDRVHPEITEIRAKVRKLHPALTAYATRAWIRTRLDGTRHCDCNTVPPEIAGTPTEYLWRSLKCGAIDDQGNVLSRGQLRRVIR